MDQLHYFFDVFTEKKGKEYKITIEDVINNDPWNALKLCRTFAAHIHKEEKWIDE